MGIWMFGTLKELFEYRSMIFNLTRREIRGRYKGSFLGFFWNFIVPLIQILVYIVVFTMVFRSGIENYPIYLISGMIFWILFSDSLVDGSAIMVMNSDMLKKIYFPRSVLTISIVLSKVVNCLIMIMLFFIVAGFMNYGVSLEALLFLPIIIVISFFFILGIVLVLSALDVYLRDVQYLISVALMAWVWMSPIMYAAEFIENETLRSLLGYNPITYFANVYHDILYWKVIPDYFDLAVCVLLSVVTMIIGCLVFKKLEKDFAEVL